MYTNTSVLGLSLGAGALAATGFGMIWYAVAASILILGGLWLLRSGRRRAAQR
jgi:LPXTG-motif cell wall-anchored protein